MKKKKKKISHVPGKSIAIVAETLTRQRAIKSWRGVNRGEVKTPRAAADRGQISERARARGVSNFKKFVPRFLFARRYNISFRIKRTSPVSPHLPPPFSERASIARYSANESRNRPLPRRRSTNARAYGKFVINEINWPALENILTRRRVARVARARVSRRRRTAKCAIDRKSVV